MIALAQHQPRRYRSPVTVNPVADLGRSNTTRRTSAHHPTAGAFFVPAVSSYGGCAWETFGSAGFLGYRFANLRTAATQYRLATIRGSSTTHGAAPMNHIRTIRAAAHRRMAFAALHADSSLSTRLARYTHHITKARALEAVGGDA